MLGLRSGGNAGPSELAGLAGQLGLALAAGRGALVGDTACASRQLHTIDPSRPASIRVVGAADAGQVFYGRRRRGEVVHLDIFHQVGEVDHRAVADIIRQACGDYALSLAGATLWWVPAGRILPDLIDVQTATGGGRVTGELSFGISRALREAHLNHAHLSCLIPDEGLGLVFWVIAAVEREVRRQGLEIRRLESLEWDPGLAGPPLDLTPYSTPSDSLLKADPFAEDGVPRLTPSDAALAPGLSKLAMELAGEFGTLEDLERSLETMARHPRAEHWPWRNSASWGADPAAAALRQRGLLAERDGRLQLTDQGWQLYYALRASRRELENQFKRMLRRKPCVTPLAGRSQPTRRVQGQSLREARTAKEARPRIEGSRLGSIAVVPTVVAAATRALASSRQHRWTITRSDLMEPKPKPRASSDVCILLDGSASMAGRRLRAAKYLAQHLLLATRDRVAVVVFQEREARVVVPFTRDFRAAGRGLASIEPLGLTPLAQGLAAAAEYTRRTRRHDCTVLLITDGIPTVPKFGNHPMDDARRAAAELGRQRLRLVCLGLEPNRGFLTELSVAARGSLYVVDELEPEALLRAVGEQGILDGGRGPRAVARPTMTAQEGWLGRCPK
jgi:magnesium chelatase subunit D